ncbi:deoxyribose-phosphate aldolase [Haloquadratum walsbyi]|jgi:deoxyribose-phosphate aldolase|uniref:Deoxyribose-phosphate aldolase n=1 Tax=Haloquadratum walsbyi J07HQW2 TaxID=1238425 RepID=U1PSP3_9EURY|nr:deoxyribose-phosphate aldolase [Haloquadratum walsbyi]ERG95366.1 MAG: deoxyribose-phosphate aldolase [Haloquadratum walsbyi J07HQW2]
MNATDLAPRIDHTILGPTTTMSDVVDILEEAATHGMNACIPPCYVDAASDNDLLRDSDVTLVTVIGFPHGQHASIAKRQEAVAAWQAGADEVDIVLNIGRIKSGAIESSTHDIAEVVAAVPIPVKVIIETTLLSTDEKHRACQIAVDADADFLKTSTGFTDGGATTTDVGLLSDYLPVKASGGIGSYETARSMLDAGAERIGASAGVKILDEAPEN